jgi:hypothetical protein
MKLSTAQSVKSHQFNTTKNSTYKSRRVLSSTLNNPALNFKALKISDIVRQSNQILDMIGDNQEPSIPRDLTDGASNLVYKYGKGSSERQI